MVFCFDIDGVVATIIPDNNYHLAQPRRHVIDQINTLYKLGHRIILFTARGSATGIDWKAVTEQQMSTWAVLYHELRFGKPAAHYYIDDKAIDEIALQQLVEQLLSETTSS